MKNLSFYSARVLCTLHDLSMVDWELPDLALLLPDLHLIFAGAKPPADLNKAHRLGVSPNCTLVQPIGVQEPIKITQPNMNNVDGFFCGIATKFQE